MKPLPDATTVTISSKGQIVLPAAIRRRLGLNAGARLRLENQPNGLSLTLLRSVPSAKLGELKGMVRAPSRGRPRRLEELDVALLMRAKSR